MLTNTPAGPGAVWYSVLRNFAPAARTGLLTVAGQSFRVIQTAAPQDLRSGDWRGFTNAIPGDGGVRIFGDADATNAPQYFYRQRLAL